MTTTIIASAEKSVFRTTNFRLQPLVTWLHIFNFITLAVFCLLFLKIYKMLFVLYKWLFPFKYVSHCPVILVLGPNNEIVQQVVFQLSKIFQSEVVNCQDVNDNLYQSLEPKKKTQKSHIICSHGPISSQRVISELKTRVQETYGSVDILVISQNESTEGNNSTHSFLNHLNKQLLVQFWVVMTFLPGMLRRNKGHILSIALGRSSLANTGIMRTIHEELLQCNTNVKLTFVESNTVLVNNYLPSLSSDILANLILRSMWNCESVVKVPSLPCYLIMLPILLALFVLRPVARVIKLAIIRNS